MRTTIFSILLALVFVMGLGGCDLFDPSNAENPNVLEGSFLGLENSTELWLEGLERQMTMSLNNNPTTSGDGYISSAEIASDNYQNTQTFFNQFMDDLIFDITDDDIEAALFSLGDLRESAEFGLNSVVPSDPEPRVDDIADIHYFKAMSHLLVGELFNQAPADSAGPPVTQAEQLQLAVDGFTQALSMSTDATGYERLPDCTRSRLPVTR